MAMANAKLAYEQLDRAVKESRTEQRAVNETIRKLVAIGYTSARAQHPETSEGTLDGAKLRFYVWRDTPFGDDVVLCTGPSFASKVALGAMLDETTPVGIYVRTAILSKPSRAMAGAGRAARTAAPAPAPAAEAPRTRRKPESPPPYSRHAPAIPHHAAAAGRSPGMGAGYGMGRAAGEAAQAERVAQAAAEEARTTAAAVEREARESGDRAAATKAAAAKRAMSSFLSFLEEAE